MTRFRAALALLGAAALFGLTACGDKKLDTDKLETKISDGIEKQAGVQVKSVDCPGDVKVKAKDTFTCKATTTNGQSATVKVTQSDDKGNVRYEVGQ